MSGGPQLKAQCKNCGVEIVYSFDGLHFTDNGWYHNVEGNYTRACIPSWAEPANLPLDPEPWEAAFVVSDKDWTRPRSAVGVPNHFFSPRPGYEPDRSKYGV